MRAERNLHVGRSDWRYPVLSFWIPRVIIASHKHLNQHWQFLQYTRTSRAFGEVHRMSWVAFLLKYIESQSSNKCAFAMDSSGIASHKQVSHFHGVFNMYPHHERLEREWNKRFCCRFRCDYAFLLENAVRRFSRANECRACPFNGF